MFESGARGAAAFWFLASALFLGLMLCVPGALLGAGSGALSWYLLSLWVPGVLDLLHLDPVHFAAGSAFVGVVLTLRTTLRFFVRSARESEDAELRATAESIAKALRL